MGLDSLVWINGFGFQGLDSRVCITGFEIGALGLDARILTPGLNLTARDQEKAIWKPISFLQALHELARALRLTITR